MPLMRRRPCTLDRRGRAWTARPAPCCKLIATRGPGNQPDVSGDTWDRRRNTAATQSATRGCGVHRSETSRGQARKHDDGTVNATSPLAPRGAAPHRCGPLADDPTQEVAVVNT